MAQVEFERLGADPSVVAAALHHLKEWLEEEMYAPYLPYVDSLLGRGKYGVLLDSFWRMIPFGTGGRRGPVGAGPNRINPVTIGLSVQGHCHYLREVLGLRGDICVVVAHDVRQFLDLRGMYPGVTGPLSGLTSLDLARISATVYAANGITAHVTGPLVDGNGQKKCTDRYISTPELSFLIRAYGAAGGLNISASHNHPDDNGGKFYNRHGGQEIPPDDEALLAVVEQVTRVETMPYEEAVDRGLIAFVHPSHHRSYIDLNRSLCLSASRSARIGYTPLCGTGMTTVNEVLPALGFTVHLVESQSAFDGSFAPVRYRIGNPEVPESMERLQQTCTDYNCDIGFATDPDADRLGIVARQEDGRLSFFNGNEIGVLLLQGLISSMRANGRLPARGIFVNTLVTSELQRVIARSNGLQVVGDLMVGCKYIGDVLRCLETDGGFPPAGEGQVGRDTVAGGIGDWVLGCEESHGYLVSPHVRDKDACGAAVTLAALASELKDRGRTMGHLLRDIWRVYGYFRNVQRSLVMEGIDGLAHIRRIQDVLRTNPPTALAGMRVRRFVDHHVAGGPLRSGTDAASRNVLQFDLDGGRRGTVRVVVRPSGTEPKSKIYVEVPSAARLGGTLDDASDNLLKSVSNLQLDEIINETNLFADHVAGEVVRFCLGREVLGDVFGELPAEALLVSDLVTVENRIALCRVVLPGLVKQIQAGADADRWLTEELKKLGDGARGLVKNGAVAWLGAGHVTMTAEERQRALALFG